ncbi:MAG: hypothetical protein ABSG59_15920 [Verrucomicrobiota bacterium]|jgi:hypothetical protein
MKTHLVLLAAVTLGFALATVHAQPSPGGPGGQARPGPQFSGYVSKLFADNPAYTANLEFHSYGATTGNAVAAQGKLAYLNGKTRFEMDMSDARDANLPQQDASSLKQMGMDTMIAISCPDRKVNYFVYPGMRAYVRRPVPASEAAATAGGYNLEVTAVGDENVLGHNCVKNKVVATGLDGIPHESTVWNATDMNKFPIKIETVQNGATVIMLFKDLKLDAPTAAQFDPPANYKQYDNFMSLMHSNAGTQAPR